MKKKGRNNGKMKESCAKIPDYNAIKAVDLNSLIASTTNEEMIFFFNFHRRPLRSPQKGALMQIEKPIEEEKKN